MTTTTLTDLPARYEIVGDTYDVFADPVYARGVLTMDHASGGHGLPVFVREDGLVMRPADLPAGVRLEVDGDRCSYLHPEYVAHGRAEQDAACDVSIGIAWTPREYSGPRLLPAVAVQIAAARRAGYHVRA